MIWRIITDERTPTASPQSPPDPSGRDPARTLPCPAQNPAKHFADDVEISEKHLSRIINGHARIDAPLAARIAKTLGTTTLFWVNLQASVDAWDGEQAEADWQPQTVYPPERAAS